MYMLTAHYVPAIVRATIRFQSKLMFVIALEMDNFDYQKKNTHFQSIHNLSKGGAH